MMNTHCYHRCRVAVLVTTLAMVISGGCNVKDERDKSRVSKPVPKSATASAIGPETSAVAVDMSKGWCNGHSVPESVCTRCSPSLVAKFKAGQDWCGEHGLPESQCTNCNPEAREQWAALNPANARTPTGGDDSSVERASVSEIESDEVVFGPAYSPVEPTLDQGWCDGHGVPESVCTRCGASPDPFMEAGDWCDEHDLPETQCVLCNPEVEAEWARLNPARQEEFEAQRNAAEQKTLPHPGSEVEGSIQLEPNRQLLTGRNDSLCQVDRLQVRFFDGSTARKAGIETEVVRTRRLSNAIECLAEVGFDETRLVRVTPRVSGVVTESAVEIGRVVSTDDLLAVMESPTLGQAKSRYISVREGYLLATSDFERVDTIFRGTQRMLAICTAATSSGDVREELIEVRVGDAKSRLLQAHASLELARSTLKREQSLFDKKISSEQSLETARSNLASAEADFHATHEAVTFASERDRLAAMRTLKVARSELDAVARELHILGLDDAQLATIGSESGVALSRYELRSPASGRIVERRAVVGEVVEQQDALFTVADLSTMWVMMDLRERDLTLVRVGLPVLLTVDGLPGHAFDGVVSWISDMVDDRTRTVKVRANFLNQHGLLRANMFGHARIIVRDNDEVVSIPTDAVQTDGCCQLVFVKQNETLFEPRKVTLGASVNGHVEILAGLTPGESVVTVGSFLMKTEILKSNIGAGCCDVEQGR